MVGLVIDLGTTNIDSRAYDLETGALISKETGVNPQAQYGADVISRVHAARSEVVREELTGMLRDAVHRAVTASGAQKQVIVGNTVMLHFLCGLSVAGFASAPFTAETLRPVFPGPVFIPPCIGPFLGADFVAGVTYIWKKTRQPFWLLDVGTNCEIGFFDGEKLLAASVAAGPAFEGGSTLIHDVAMELTTGRLLKTGLVAKPGLVTQREVRKLQLAKGAVAGGLKILFAPSPQKISGKAPLFLGGAFGDAITEEDARTIGLIPEFLQGPVRNVGNAALEGAALLLVDKAARMGTEKIAAKSVCWDLGGNPDFEKSFISNLNFPKGTNEDTYGLH